jgi:lipopolysaccharide transport system permease protein
MFDLHSNVAALKEAVGALQRHRELVLEMARREVLDRYAGSALGGAWAIGAPLLMFASNLFAFMYIMRLRLGVEDSGLHYALFVLAGMTAWYGIQDGLGRAPTAVVASANLVKQIVFPSEILPLKVALATLPSIVVGVVLTIVLSVFAGTVSLFGLLVLLPICLVYYAIMLTGCVYALATLGVFLRDIKDIISVLLSIGLFLHPIFYPPASTPPWVDVVFHLSPFSHLIWCFRDALFYGTITKPWSWIIAPAVGIVFLAVGWRIFRMLRPTFGNAL